MPLNKVGPASYNISLNHAKDTKDPDKRLRKKHVVIDHLDKYESN
jgi:hypothetical protein